MASGDNCILIHSESLPATSYASPDTRAGGSSPAERVDIYKFDAAIEQYVDFKCQLVNYDGGGITFSGPWSASSATTGNTRWGIAIRAFPDDAEDLDASHSYDFNDVDDTCASASGEIVTFTVSFTNGADMDSWANGAMAIVRVRRAAAHANDTMSGYAELWGLSAVET